MVGFADNRRTDAPGSERCAGSEDPRAIALGARCPVATETAIRDILISGISKSEQAQTLLDIGHVRQDLPFIQIRVLSELLVLDPARARKLSVHLIQQPFDEDREHVRAKAYATLVELPEKTLDDVRMLIRGLAERSRAVKSGIALAIDDLQDSEKRELRGLCERIEQIEENATHTSKLTVLLKVPYAPPQSGSAATSAVPGAQDGNPLPARPNTAKIIPEVPSTKASTKPVMRAAIEEMPRQARDSAPTILPRAHVKTPVVEEAVAQSFDGRVSAHRKHPQPGIDTPLSHSSLDAMRDPKFHSMPWAELLAQRNSLVDPHEACACFAEMAVRFDRELARDLVASRLLWVMSHPEPEIKLKAVTLFRELFDSARPLT